MSSTHCRTDWHGDLGRSDNFNFFSAFFAEDAGPEPTQNGAGVPEPVSSGPRWSRVRVPERGGCSTGCERRSQKARGAAPQYETTGWFRISQLIRAALCRRSSSPQRSSRRRLPVSSTQPGATGVSADKGIASYGVPVLDPTA